MPTPAWCVQLNYDVQVACQTYLLVHCLALICRAMCRHGFKLEVGVASCIHNAMRRPSVSATQPVSH